MTPRHAICLFAIVILSGCLSPPTTEEPHQTIIQDQIVLGQATSAQKTYSFHIPEHAVTMKVQDQYDGVGKREMLLLFADEPMMKMASGMAEETQHHEHAADPPPRAVDSPEHQTPRHHTLPPDLGWGLHIPAWAQGQQGQLVLTVWSDTTYVLDIRFIEGPLPPQA